MQTAFKCKASRSASAWSALCSSFFIGRVGGHGGEATAGEGGGLVVGWLECVEGEGGVCRRERESRH